jgi:hypothetical protein
MKIHKNYTFFIVTILTLSIIFITIPIAYAISITAWPFGNTGSPGDMRSIAGTSTTTGGLIEVYWDHVKAWDGTAGKIAEGYATGSSFNVLFFVPSSTAGPHNVIVRDVTAGDTDSAVFYVIPDMHLNPDIAILGDVIEVLGFGFSPNEDITMFYWDGTAYQTLTTNPLMPRTNSTGIFICTFTVPMDAENRVDNIPAEDESHWIAAATLDIGPFITVDPWKGIKGSDVQVSGRGFKPNGIVDIEWLIGGSFIIVSDDAPIDSKGEFSETVTVPSLPDPVAPGTDYTIRAVDNSIPTPTIAFTYYTLIEYPKIKLTPPAGKILTPLLVEGKWFAPGRPITITFDGVEIATTTSDCVDGYFDATAAVPDVAVGPYTVTAFDDRGNTDSSIFTVVENGFLVVRGSNNRIYYRNYDDVWGDWKVVPSGTTCDTPAAAVQDGKLYMVVRGMDGNSLFFGSINLVDDSFSGWSYLNGATPSKPILIRDGDEGLCLVVRGTDNRIYYRFYNCPTDNWNGWLVTPTGTTPDTPAAAINGDYLHLVVRGMTGGIYHQEVYIPTQHYYGWNIGSGDTPSAPTLTNYGDDVILVVRGNNNIIYYKIWNGGWPVHFTSIPEATTHLQAYGPAAVVIGNQLHIVVLSSGGYMAHGYLYLDTDVWEPWEALSGSTPSGPTLTN